MHESSLGDLLTYSKEDTDTVDKVILVNEV